MDIDAFSPARLSPQRVRERTTDLPYGVSRRDLHAALPDLDERSTPRILLTHTVRGLHDISSSRLVTVAYRHRDGHDTRRTLFLKATTQHEAAAYDVLARRGVPVADVLAIVPTARGPVLVLDFLPTIGIEADEADVLLDLVARLNAVVDPPVPQLSPRPGMPSADFDALVRSTFVDLAGDPANDLDPQRWMHAYDQAQRTVARLPTALNHGELFFQQVGWTGGPERRLVLIDLETVAVLPCFSDVASVLGGLRLLTGRSEQDLFATYLDRLPGHGGPRPPAAEAWRDLLLTRAVRDVQTLPWLASSVGDPDVATTATEVADRVREDLTALGLLP